MLQHFKQFMNFYRNYSLSGDLSIEMKLKPKLTTLLLLSPNMEIRSLNAKLSVYLSLLSQFFHVLLHFMIHHEFKISALHVTVYSEGILFASSRNQILRMQECAFHNPWICCYKF